MCQFFYPEEVSSALLPYQTAKKLTSEGITVSVLCGYPKKYKEGKQDKVAKKEIKNGININRISYLQLVKKNKISRLINYFSFIFSMVFQLPKCKKAKIIMVYSNPPLLPVVSLIANRLYKTKIVFVSYDVYPEIAIELDVLRKDSFISKVTRRINERLFEKSSKVVVLSEEMKRYYVENKNIDSEKIEIIENWATENYVPTNKVINSEISEINNNYKIVVTYLGNMGKAQDIQTIIECICSKKIDNKNIAFVFAGRGEKKDNIIDVKKKNNLENVFVLDYLLGEDLNSLLNISDLFIVSLDNKLAGLAVPSKTYSYYQAKKPVVAIMNKEMQVFKEIKDNDCGVSIENGESKKLICFLNELVSNEKMLLRLKENMENLSQIYTEDKQNIKYINMINKILGE